MTVAAEEIFRQPTGLLSWPFRTFAFLRRYPVIAGIILTLLAVGAVFAPFLSPYDPGKRILDDREIPPLWAGDGMVSHPLGTDHLGRDIFSRILYGARISLMVAGIAVSVGVVAGTATGLIAGYFGGWADEILMRAVDLWLALPFLLLVLVVAVSLGSSLSTVIWLLAVSSWSTGARNIRGDVLSLKTLDYVALAKVSGATHLRIIMRHLLPHVMHIVIVVTTLRTGQLIIAEAGLSFLGVGVPSSTPTWGNMIAEGQQFLLTSWWIAILPGVAIFFTVTAFNFLGDWLRDHFDPRLRQIA